MKYLSNILERLEAGSESAIREHLDTALGLWASDHGAACQIVAVSENSVSWADQETNLFVAHYSLNEGIVHITDVKKVLNVAEEQIDTAFMEEMAADIVRLVSENKEDQAKAMVGTILEYKVKAVRAGRLVRINDPKTRARAFKKKGYSARWHIVQAARKTARKSAFKATKVMRQGRSMKKRARMGINENILEAIDALPGAAINLMVALESQYRSPVIEGFVVEKDGEKPFMMKKKDKKSKHAVPGCKTDESAEELLTAITEGRVHSTGVKVSVPGEKLAHKGGDGHLPAGDYEIAKANSRTTHLLARGSEKGKHSIYPVATAHLKRLSKESAKAAAPKASAPDADGEPEKKTEEAIIVVNLNSLNESFAKQDFFRKAALAWDQFRSEPVTEEVAKLLSEKAEPAAILAACPFLGLCTEDEVYEAIAPHLDAFDPNEIKAVAKAIKEAVNAEQAKKDFDAYLDQFADQEIKESLLAEPIISEALDALFLEGDQFDLGSADDLGADDLDKDPNTDGMGATGGAPGETDDSLDPESGDMEMDDAGQGNMVDMQIDADEAREQFKKILSVVATEIEDNDEFKALKDKLDDDQQEITGDDITALLKTVTDYFEATGKSMEDKEELEDEKAADGETLDDMDNDDLTQGGDHDDTEGDTNDLGSDNQDELELGK